MLAELNQPTVNRFSKMQIVVEFALLVTIDQPGKANKEEKNQ